MTRDLAADLAEVFWHMTWDLCISFAMMFNYTWGMHFSIFLTDDMGIFDQFWQESWDFQENTSAICFCSASNAATIQMPSVQCVS